MSVCCYVQDVPVGSIPNYNVSGGSEHMLCQPAHCFWEYYWEY